MFIERPELVCPLIDEIRLLHEARRDDFLILKYLVKTMVGFQEVTEVSEYDSMRLKARIAEARQLEAKLVRDHEYTKYGAHLDLLEITELTEQLGVQEMDNIIRPYLMGRARDIRWEFLMY